MAEKKIPAPIDRPLSRAYLREFSGWSTAYPPGMSDPSSLRVMENLMINRDGSIRVRPGLRYLSWGTAPVPGEDGAEPTPGIPYDLPLVGSHEAFYLNDGTKAYLFAVRELDLTVGFRVLVFAADGATVRELTDPDIGFTITQDLEVLNFTEDTTYVKYLQIDNKIFALSNAGEEMRLFGVGKQKSAKKLSSIERPEWSVADKLTVVHPDASWIDSGVPTKVRTNRVLNPSFTVNLANWASWPLTLGRRSTAVPAKNGSGVMRLESLPERTNLVYQPLHDVDTRNSAYGWWDFYNLSQVTPDGTYLKATIPAGSRPHGTLSSYMTSGIRPRRKYQAAVSFGASSNISKLGILVRFYNNSNVRVGEDFIQRWWAGSARRATVAFTAPAGATKFRLMFVGYRNTDAAASFRVKDVVLCEADESTAAFTGSSGADYYWEGAANNSASVYHPARDIRAWTSMMPVAAGKNFSASAWFRAGSVANDAQVFITWYKSTGQRISDTFAPLAADAAGAWSRSSIIAAAPAGATQARLQVSFRAVARGSYHYVDSVLFENNGVLEDFFDGSLADTATLTHEWLGRSNASQSRQTTYSTALAPPDAETRTADTLISSQAGKNVYNFGFFYTFSNEVGESAASQLTVVRAQRRWTAWKWETPNAAGEPSGDATFDPAKAADQLVAKLPADVFTEAVAQGATQWHLYMLTWSDQASVPVEAVKLVSTDLTETSTLGNDGWARMSPQQVSGDAETTVLPTRDTRFNYSDPSRGGQGIVAADRMIMVYDPTDAARVKWSSNQQGEYTNFSASKGGGYKTLTSGNLQVPACVKLWQNPQSADTLTVLCLGTDGQTTSYYMAPAQVASQSEAVNIMAFEETTATPGTTSPYGVEVLNNGLYHPLETELMKSTASNYNISHKTQTEQIADKWAALASKEHIVSAQLDNRLYYLVNNLDGEELAEGCMGNELWVLDAGKDGGTWSRWLIQGMSLRKIEQGGQTYMSVVRPDGLYYLDPLYDRDDYVDEVTGSVLTRFIPWEMETNTQGANRAHDAWAHLQQVALTLGMFAGQLRWGIRAWDINGKAVEVSKVTHSPDYTDAELEENLAFDIEDFLLIRRDLQEWRLFASSVTEVTTETVDVDGVPTEQTIETVQPSFGQLSLVQYRYTPSTVNTGYAWGSVETFEYRRAEAGIADRTTDNGIPRPMLDMRRP